MSPHLAVSGRQMIERWATLAESRLNYLTDLFESGRWRRFHTEVEFLENIQEAKAAVDRWRAMATQEATFGNMPVTWSWLDRPNGVPSSFNSAPIGSVLHEAPRAARPAVPAKAAPVALKVSPPLQPERAPLREAAVTPAELDWKRALDPEVLGERYPMLRTATI